MWFLSDQTTLARQRPFKDLLYGLSAVGCRLWHEKGGWILKHPAEDILGTAFVHYVSTNVPQKARDHFYGLREGKDDLSGILIFDRLDKKLNQSGPLIECMWKKREIENYFCTEEVLMAFAEGRGEFFEGLQPSVKKIRIKAMEETIQEVTGSFETLGKPSPWSGDVKSS